MLDGRPRRRIWCEVGVLTVIKGVGELRYNTFTTTRSNACFLVGIDTVYNGYSDSVNPI